MATCNWCGNGIATDNSIKVGWGFKMRFYCSNKCKTAGEEAYNNSNGSKCLLLFIFLFVNVNCYSQIAKDYNYFRWHHIEYSQEQRILMDKYPMSQDRFNNLCLHFPNKDSSCPYSSNVDSVDWYHWLYSDSMRIVDDNLRTIKDRNKFIQDSLDAAITSTKRKNLTAYTETEPVKIKGETYITNDGVETQWYDGTAFYKVTEYSITYYIKDKAVSKSYGKDRTLIKREKNK